MEGSYVLKIHEIVFPRRSSDWFLEVQRKRCHHKIRLCRLIFRIQATFRWGKARFWRNILWPHSSLSCLVREAWLAKDKSSTNKPNEKIIKTCFSCGGCGSSGGCCFLSVFFFVVWLSNKFICWCVRITRIRLRFK